MNDDEKKHDSFGERVFKYAAFFAAITTLTIPFRAKIANFIEKNNGGTFGKGGFLGNIIEWSTGIVKEDGKINSIGRSYIESIGFGTGWGVIDYTLDRIDHFVLKRIKDKPTVGKHTERLQKQQTETTIERQ